MLRRICLLMGVLMAASVWAQGTGRDAATYPTRHVRMIAPFTGGSTLDIMGRLIAEMFKTEAGIDVVHVPYKGSGPAMTDVLGRQIDMTFVSTVFVQPFIKAERVRALALTGNARSPVLADVPTFRELGLPGVEMTGWYGLWFPAKTPPDRVNHIQSEIRNAVASAEMKSRLEEFGLVGVASSPAEFAKFLREDFELQNRIAKQAGIHAQ